MDRSATVSIEERTVLEEVLALRTVKHGHVIQIDTTEKKRLDRQ